MVPKDVEVEDSAGRSADRRKCELRAQDVYPPCASAWAARPNGLATGDVEEEEDAKS